VRRRRARAGEDAKVAQRRVLGAGAPSPAAGQHFCRYRDLKPLFLLDIAARHHVRIKIF